MMKQFEIEQYGLIEMLFGFKIFMQDRNTPVNSFLHINSIKFIVLPNDLWSVLEPFGSNL